MKELSRMTPYELGESGKEEAIRHLILYLSRGTPNEKRLAASAINKLSVKYSSTCKKAIPFLVENLSDSHHQVRQYTLKALSRFQLTSAYLKVINDIAQNDQTEYNRREAKQILDRVKQWSQENTIDKKVLSNIQIEEVNFIEAAVASQYEQHEERFIELVSNRCGIKFTEKQKAAVLHKDGPALVLAVPGAGKTTVLLARTANLIINYGINPANILSITFSRASANDMKNRYNNIFSSITSIGGNFSTIHSFCYELIRKYSQLYNMNFTVIEHSNSQITKVTLLKKCYQKYNGELIDDDALDELINSIGYVKNMMFSPEEIEAYSESLDINRFTQIFCEYESIKKENKYLDYDDMLSLAYDILNKDSEMLERYRQLYRYIQVDEGQDTSKLQHKIIQLIAEPENNVFIVADDDQSIYSFRGAYPKFLLEIDSLYPSTRRFYIEENFRSTTEIVKLANDFIKSNEIRFNKELYTRNARGNPVRIVSMKNEKEQWEFLLKEFNNKNIEKNKAILYRNNMTSILLADELSRRSITFYLKDYNRFFFKHFVTEDIKAFLCFVLNNSDVEAFGRIYYRMNSFIQKDTVNIIKTNFRQGKDIFEGLDGMPINDLQKRNLIRMKSVFATIRYFEPSKIVEYIDKELGYSKYLKDNARLLGYSYEGLRAILINLKALAARCSSVAGFLVRLEELEHVMEVSTKYTKESIVTLLTMHSSKGLEFTSVYIIDLFDNIIPNRNSVDDFEIGKPESMEEERRLMYVAMTRARRDLTLITIEKKNEETAITSRFVLEIENIIESKPQ
jgi:DNA helicase II / ATP-dependent DNA helicase PcrA